MKEPPDVAAIVAACPRTPYRLPCALLDDRVVGEIFCHVCQKHRQAEALARARAVPNAR